MTPIDTIHTWTAAGLRPVLAEIAFDLGYSWHPEVRELFRRLDPEMFKRVGGGSPAVVLAETRDETLECAARDEEFRAAVRRVESLLAAELAAPTWWERAHPERGSTLVAYFSAEFGLDAGLPIYSGGLGVLAGDHLKSASELGIPLVGVGLLYRQGYFRQRLDDEGRQVEEYPPADLSRLPVTREPVDVEVELAGQTVTVGVWRARVGRVALYLLEAEGITDVLYGGDREHRMQQEVVLGIGGVRALAAVGLEPTVFHMNEGHSAFLALERIRLLVEQGRDFASALERVRSSTVFTTHTPVPAGNEVFDPELVRRYLGALVARCGIAFDEFLALGRADPGDSTFGLTPLALRTSAHANGVSALHGSVSRSMWAGLWPGRSAEGSPIGHVTNGVHARTWLSAELSGLLRAAGVRPEVEPEAQAWERVAAIEPRELWLAHRACKERLFERIGAAGLDREALTIGFARRFATYKRAGLLFSDPDRLLQLLRDAGRPVQLLLAGKAHPADEGGKALLRQVFAFSRDPRSRGRIVVLQNYDLSLAPALVQGVDVWLNTPRRPLEASGTSGMKAGMNGGLNVSVLDGWWVEGYAPELGWALGETVGPDEAAQDAADAAELYRLLEEEVVPAFYERGDDGLPARWLGMMSASIERVGGAFNSHRMLVDYVERLYRPADSA